MHKLTKRAVILLAAALMTAILPMTAMADNNKDSVTGPGVESEPSTEDTVPNELPQTPGPVIFYSGYITGTGWSDTRQNGDLLNTAGSLDAVQIHVENIDGGITYRVFLQKSGWQEWKSDGAIAGLPGEGNIIEAIQLKLTGNTANHLDVYYSSVIGSEGTLDWAKNGQASGSIGYGYPILDFRIKLLAKITEAPGAMENSLVSVFSEGFQDIDGVKMFLHNDSTAHNGWLDYENNRYYIQNGLVLTGWQYLDGLKFYFNEAGVLVQDLDPIIGIQPSYQIRINKLQNCVTIYAQDGANGYIIPVKAMLCSTGPTTPLGTFRSPTKHRWQLMVNDTWTQFATRIKAGAGFLIHSICYEKPNNMSLLTDGYNYLGINQSLGCVRLVAVNAKWVYDNCKLGTEIIIYENPVASPFYKPTVTPIPPEQRYDPTDPTVNLPAGI